ncbi:ABC-type branched-chain amino acid transport system, substrate-binding protein [Paraburkholderia fungorum]|uniref:ABC-type branched-chain amino acid transport system, substrate-binding protein n=1 Tax=Paraburkholderia fungorum TaxID=134537 RepID=A0A1H1JCK2_9BURK|nr:ABC transporter substrate-binding protein [Paraburkholderia fungorum]SDR47490.1 ABC-type branched-chain amino acid transport system, substrate-binding protein [Paraburkholderia fungorum]
MTLRSLSLGGVLAATTLACALNASAESQPPVLVGFIIAASGSPFAVTDPGRVAQIAARAVNDEGGINGRKLVVEICDTKGQPAASIACARRLADEGAITLIGGSSANGVDKILRAKNMAAWFPMGSDPSDVRNPLSFITALNGAGAAQGTYLGAKRFGAKRAVYVSMLGNKTYQETARFGYEQAGVTDVQIVEVPPSTTDFAPYIAKIKALHPDVWGGMLYPPEQQTLLVEAAAQQGIRIPFVSSNNVIEDATIAALSKAPFPNSLALEKGEDAKRFPTWSEYERQLAKYDPNHEVKGPTDGTTTTDWLAVWTFAQIARKLPTVTVDSFREHVAHERNFTTDVLHPIDFTAVAPVQGMPRQENIWAFAGHVEGGHEVVDDPAPYSAWQKTPVKPWSAQQIAEATGK